jgi:hypothetical protein
MLGRDLGQQVVGILADLVEAALQHGLNEALAVSEAEVQGANRCASVFSHRLHRQALESLRFEVGQASIQQRFLCCLAAGLQGESAVLWGCRICLAIRSI